MKVLEFIVVCLGILISASAKKAKKTKEVVQKTNESITPWEYCEGCKISVDLFSNRATKRLAEMQSNHVKSGEVFNADSVVQGMCDAEELTANYIPAMKWSCVKITSDNLTAFLNPWLGSASAADSSAKGGVFEKKREICVEGFQACKDEVFSKGDVPLEDRNKCSACRIIAADIHAASTTASLSVPAIDIVENICNQLGYLHQPYAWIESHCDEIIEENADEIAEMVAFRKRMKLGGQNPDRSLPDAMCNDLYSCDKGGPKQKRKKQQQHSKSSKPGRGRGAELR